MSKLSTYTSLQNKSHAFNQIIITEKNDVDFLLINHLEDNIKKEKENRFIYRGVTNARYKIYSSSQRNYAEKELTNITSYDNLISGIIQEALNYQNGLLRTFLSSLNIPFHIPVLSFLQHYGAPTPLIDWTYNSQVAIYFTTDGQMHIPSDNDIDNYFSIYCIDKKECGSELINISKWLAINIGSLLNIESHYPDVDISDVFNRIRTFNYEEFRQLGIFYVSDFEREGNFPALTSISNLNIINQQGLFIYNSSQSEPLEAFFGTGRDPFSGLPKIKCYDIHKSLYYYVLERITSKRSEFGLEPLTKEFIYPQEEAIAKVSFTKYLSR